MKKPVNPFQHTFVVIGDTHLAPGPRQADRLAALEQIIAFGSARRDLAAWLWPGDLFHATSTTADRNTLKELVKRMADRAPVVICYGNHDQAGDLDIFADLAATHRIRVVARPEVLLIDLATAGEAAIFVLPYPHKGGLVGAGVAHDDLAAEARHLLEPVFMDAAAKVADAAAQGVPALFIGHVNIGGAQASGGQPQIGREIELDPALLGRLGDIPKFVNHIHKPQELHGAYIPGSIAAMDFGEMEAKRFLAATWRSDGRWEIVSHPIALPQQYLIEGTLTRDAFTIATINGAPHDALSVTPDFTGADVRVRFSYRKGEISALDQARIHADFATTRTLKVEGTPIRDGEIRAKGVVEAETLTEKARRYCEHVGVEWTEGLAAKLDALQQADPADVIKAVADLDLAPAEAEVA